MGRRINTSFKIVSLFILLIISFSCGDLNLRELIEDKVIGWKIENWIQAEPVVEGYTHEDNDELSQGFPQKLLIAENDQIHLFCYKVRGGGIALYTTKKAGNEKFDQSYIEVSPTGLDYCFNPFGVDFATSEIPRIAIPLEGTGTDITTFDYNNVEKDWGSEDLIYNVSSGTVNDVFLFFLTQDVFDPHVFYTVDDSDIINLYHTKQLSKDIIEPDPPEVYLSDIGAIQLTKSGKDDIVFVYTNADRTKLYYNTYRNPAEKQIWSTPASLGIYSIAVIIDKEKKAHICMYIIDTENPSLFSKDKLYYISNINGSWEVMDVINGDDESGSGPFNYISPPSIAMTVDSKGNNHLHLVYTVLIPVADCILSYAYFDEGEWQFYLEDPLEDSLDPDHTNTFFTATNLVADSKGCLHLVYSWAVGELDRTCLYMKGIPEKEQ